MAIFANVKSAIAASIKILTAVDRFNVLRQSKKEDPVFIGLSINTGPVILGPVGDEKRMSGTVIGNAVNVGSRMVSLTKMYGVRMITSKIAIEKMVNKELKGVASPFVFRELDRVKVAVTILGILII